MRVIIQNMESIPIKTAARRVGLDILAIDPAIPLKSIRVWVNDVPIYGRKGLNVSHLNSKEIRQRLDIELTPGPNKIQIASVNRNGIQSLMETIDIPCTATANKPNLYLVGIGVEKYNNGLQDLNFPKEDINGIRKLYEKKTDLYNRIIPIILFDEQVTLASIQNIRQQLMPKSS